MFILSLENAINVSYKKDSRFLSEKNITFDNSPIQSPPLQALSHKLIYRWYISKGIVKKLKEGLTRCERYKSTQIIAWAIMRFSYKVQ